MADTLNVTANPADASAQPKESELVKNIVTNENAQAEGNILDGNIQDQDAELLKNIISQDDEDSPETATPSVDHSLLNDVAPSKSVLLISLKIIFGILVGVGIAGAIFFTSQLTDTFDSITSRISTNTFEIPNISQAVENSNANIIQVQTDINFYRYLEIKGYLDRFSYHSDSFVQNFEIANSKTSSELEVREAQKKMEEALTPMRESFMAASEEIKKPIFANIVAANIANDADRKLLFETELRKKLQNTAMELQKANNEEGKTEARNYTQTAKLVGNDKLSKILIETDFAALSAAEVYNLVKDIDALVVNDLSTIQDIKDQRIKWSDVINEINLRTSVVDKYYDESTYEQLGGIRYTSYDFDSRNSRITIVGETKRFDPENFTMIATLIEELNKSEIFENAEMRSFSKSGSTEEGYTATLKISMDLQKSEVTQ